MPIPVEGRGEQEEAEKQEEQEKQQGNKEKEDKKCLSSLPGSFAALWKPDEDRHAEVGWFDCIIMWFVVDTYVVECIGYVS